MLLLAIVTPFNVNLERLNVWSSTQGTTYQEVTSDKAEKLVEVIDKIYAGKGEREDYLFIGLNNVNDVNIDWLNAEIQDTLDFNIDKDKVDERKNSIINSVDSALKYYPNIRAINDGNETLNDNGIIEYYNITGKWIDESKLSLIQMAVTIEKDLKSRDLTSKEITHLIDDCLENVDLKYIVKAIRNEIDYAKSNSGEVLSESTVQKIIDDTIEKANDCYKNIITGCGSIEDYYFIQIQGATKENITWMNAEIRDIAPPIEDRDGKIENAQELVNKLLTIYPDVRAINDGNETLNDNGVIEYYNLTGRWINESNLVKARQDIALAKIAKGRDLTTKEITNILELFY